MAQLAGGRRMLSALARPLGVARNMVRCCGSMAEVPFPEASEGSETKQRIVVAVGGNALIRRGERLTIENQMKAARADASPALLKLLQDNELVVTYGNGPQVGELALERSAATFDVLGAESQGQIGYIFSQAMAGVGVSAVAILTQVMVDPTDPAFKDPTKFVGPVYGAMEAKALSESLGWNLKPDGEYFRRVVASPTPLKILQVDAVRALLAVQTPTGPLPLVCGGGGVPVTRMGNDYANIPAGAFEGLEAVIDKDRCGALLAQELDADGYIILTDGGGIWENFGKPGAREMKAVSASYLRETKAGAKFPGSMKPKVEAAIDFVENSPKPGAWAALGDLKDASKIVLHQEGTLIKKQVDGNVEWYDRSGTPAMKIERTPRYP